MRDHSSGSYKPQIKTFQGLILEETALEKIPPLPLPAFVGFIVFFQLPLPLPTNL